MAQVPAPVAKILRANGIALEDVSLYVHEVNAPRPLVAINAQVPRNPASAMKLLTSRAGLDLLGPSFTWKTEAYLRGRLSDGRLDGDLILKGYGDPNLSPSDLWRLLWGVRERGVVTVGGDILLDQSYFAPIEGERGDFDGAAESPYNALPSALSVNAQITDIRLVAEGAGTGLRVFTDPPSPTCGWRTGSSWSMPPARRSTTAPRSRSPRKGRSPHSASAGPSLLRAARSATRG